MMAKQEKGDMQARCWTFQQPTVAQIQRLLVETRHRFRASKKGGVVTVTLTGPGYTMTCDSDNARNAFDIALAGIARQMRAGGALTN